MARRYRPSNSTEGELFREQFCYQCKRDTGEPEPCPILTATFILDVRDPDYPPEWVEDDATFPHTNPRCLAFDPIDEPPDPRQLGLDL